MSVPMTVTFTADRTPTRNAIRAPCTVWLNTSFPVAVVPKRNSREGGRFICQLPSASFTMSLGRWGAIHPANTAPRMNSGITTRPNRASGFVRTSRDIETRRLVSPVLPPGWASAVGNSRVQIAIQEVGDQIGHDDDHRDHEEGELGDGIVGGEDGVDEQLPESRPAEDRLD